MSEKLTQGLSISIVGLIIFGMIIGGYLILENQKVTKQNEQSITKQDKNIQYINKTLNGFVDMWEKRIKTSNSVNNLTQDKLLSLANNQTTVLKTQINNEKNIIGNLTAHRHVANFTRDITIGLQNSTLKNQEYLIELEKQMLDLQNDTKGLVQQLDVSQQRSIANLTAQNNEAIKILKGLTGITSD